MAQIDKFIEGEILMMEKKYEDAIQLYLKLYEQIGNDATLNYSIGEAYVQLGDIEKAIQFLNQSYQIDTDNIEFGYKVYNLYLLLGDDKNAAWFLDILIKNNPINIELLLDKTQFQFKNEDWDGIIESYVKIYEISNNAEYLEKLIEIAEATEKVQFTYDLLKNVDVKKNNLIQYLTILSSFAYTLGEFENALMYLQQLKDENNNHDSYLLSAQIQLYIGKYDEALENLLYVYEKGERTHYLLKSLLICYSNIDDIDNEMRISQEFVKLYPNEELGYESLALAKIQKLEFSAAIEILNQAVIKFPESFALRFYLGSVYKELNKYDYAIDEFTTALKIQENSNLVFHSMALVYESQKEYVKSDSLFKKILDSDTYNAMDMNDYAYVISERIDTTPSELSYALELANQAIELDPENPMILDTIGWIYFKQNKYNKALTFLQRSYENSGNNLVILDHLGDVYLKLGNIEKAQINYESALKLDPTNFKIKLKLEALNVKN